MLPTVRGPEGTQDRNSFRKQYHPITGSGSLYTTQYLKTFGYISIPVRPVPIISSILPTSKCNFPNGVPQSGLKNQSWRCFIVIISLSWIQHGRYTVELLFCQLTVCCLLQQLFSCLCVFLVYLLFEDLLIYIPLWLVSSMLL